MSKRSNFERVPKENYPTTDPRPVAILASHLEGVETYAEPCVGDGILVQHLSDIGLDCGFACDVELRGIPAEGGVLPTRFGHVPCYQKDALNLSIMDVAGCDVIITNPPWRRDWLHPMIEHFASLKPTWLLFDADWAHTVQAAPYLAYCTRIVSVGRVKWFPDSPHQAMDNCAWYRFHKGIDDDYRTTAFIPRTPKLKSRMEIIA